MTEALDSYEKDTWQFVKFNDAADGTVLAAFTDRDSDDTFDGVAYTSEPSLEVQLSINDGMLSSDSPTKIKLPSSPINASASAQQFLDRISSGLPYQTVEVSISEVSVSEGQPTSTLNTFKGDLDKLVQGSDDTDTITFEALTIKQQLQPVKLGMPAEHQCINALGDGLCQLSLAAFTYTLSITNIDGKVVTCSGVPNGLAPRFFLSGYLQVGTLRVRIQNWRSEAIGDKTQFFMQERVPSYWDGATVTAVAGCDKSIETCTDVFSNTAHFNGWGYAMPEYHPVYENGAGRREDA